MTFVEYLHSGTTTATISGAVNGTNTLFTVPVSPYELQVYLNGMLQLDGALGLSPADFQWTNDALLGTATITFSASSTPQSGDILAAWVFTLVP